MTLGPTVRDGEHAFGVAHIFASFNDTFIVSINITVSSLNWNFYNPTMNIGYIWVAACYWLVWERNPCSHYWYALFLILLFHQNGSIWFCVHVCAFICVCVCNICIYSLKNGFLYSLWTCHIDAGERVEWLCLRVVYGTYNFQYIIHLKLDCNSISRWDYMHAYLFLHSCACACCQHLFWRFFAPLFLLMFVAFMLFKLMLNVYSKKDILKHGRRISTVSYYVLRYLFIDVML